MVMEVDNNQEQQAHGQSIGSEDTVAPEVIGGKNSVGDRPANLVGVAATETTKK